MENDRIVALDDLPGLEKLIESRKPYMREISHMFDGKTYSVPSAMTTRGLIYNKDMFKEAGLVDENGEPTPPKTFDELREYAKRLTDKKKGTYGIVLPLKWTSWVSSDIEGLAPASFGRGAYNAADGTYDYTVMKPIIETFLGIRDDESFYPGAEGLDNDPARARFAEGNIGMKLSYSFDVGVFNEQFPASMDWGVAPLPVYDLNKTYHQPATMDIGLKISKGAVDLLGEETAAEIYNWFYSDEIIKQLYAEGLEIPYSWDLVKDVEMKEEKKGWTEFCQMAEISAVTPLTMPKTKTDSFAELILNDIWTGNVTDIDKALKQYSDKVNNAVAEYKGTYPDTDYSIYIKPEWNGELER